MRSLISSGFSFSDVTASASRILSSVLRFEPGKSSPSGQGQVASEEAVADNGGGAYQLKAPALCKALLVACLVAVLFNTLAPSALAADAGASANEALAKVFKVIKDFLLATVGYGGATVWALALMAYFIGIFKTSTGQKAKELFIKGGVFVMLVGFGPTILSVGFDVLGAITGQDFKKPS